MSTVNEGGNPNKDGIFKSDDFTVRRRERGGTLSTVDHSKATVVSNERIEWNERGELLDPRTGYPQTTSDMDITKTEEQKRLQQPYAPAEQTQLFDNMFAWLGVTTEPLMKLLENLDKHQYKVESDKNYRQADLQDLQKEDASRSNIKKFIKRYEQEVKPKIEKIEAEIARYRQIEKERNQSTKRKAS